MITVIVNSYPRGGRTEDLQHCLEALTKQTYTFFEVLIVENFSSDKEVIKITESFNSKLKIRYTYDPIKRLSRLFNIGWKTAKSELLAYCADDTYPDKNWLKNIVADLKKDSTIAAVSGPVLSDCFPTGEMHRLYLLMNHGIVGRFLIKPYIYLAMGDHPDAPGKYFESGSYSFGSALPESIHFAKQYLDLLTTTSMGIRRSVLKKMGGFDERYIFNHADGDLFLRLKAQGYNLLFDPKVVVKHYVRLGPSRNAYFIGRDTGTFHKHHLRPIHLSGYIGAMLNIGVLQAYWVFKALTHRDLSQLKGISGYFEGVFL